MKYIKYYNQITESINIEGKPIGLENNKDLIIRLRNRDDVELNIYKR